MSQALKFENMGLHIEKFCFTYNNDTKSFYSGSSDCLIKNFDFDSTIDTYDENEEIKSICYASGKLVYGRGTNLQMAELDGENKLDTNTSMLLSNFNSPVMKILFNSKLNLIIAFSEDDDLHIVNLTTLDVLKYKSNHDGSLKNMAINPKGDLLLTVGCDGFMSVYEFITDSPVDVGKIKTKRKIKFNSKLTLEDSQPLSLDINSNNICVISGNILLRTLDLNASDSFVLSDSKMTHKKDITHVKWIDDTMLATCDLGSEMKIWDYMTKDLLYEYSSKDDITELYVLRDTKEMFRILFSSGTGSIYFTDSLNLKLNKQDKSKVLLDLPKSEIDDELNDLIKDFDQENKEEPMKELLDLSVLEDENGEINNKEQIQRVIEEKKLNQNVAQETFADRIIVTEPQEAFVPSSTLKNEKNALRYLCYNLIGNIVSRPEGDFSAIDINYSETTNKKKISFIDTNEFSMAVMNNCGAFFSNTVESENIDEYENENRRKQALIEFRPIQINGHTLMSDWSMQLPQEENPICIAIGIDWCCVYTNMGYLRIFSLFGSQKFICSLTNVMTMAGYENMLAYVYHASVPVYGSQSLRVRILDAGNMFNELYDGPLPLSPGTNLIWFGFSEDGILITYDSYNIVRGFFFGLCHNWVPLIDIGEIYENINTNFWMIGVQDEEVYGMELKGTLLEPPVTSHVIIRQHKFKIPFIKKSEEEDEEGLINKSLMIKFNEMRFNKYSGVKEIRNFKMPEYYYTDNLVEEQTIKNNKKENDKLILTRMNDLIVKGHPERVSDLFDCLCNQKSKELAITMCNEYKLIPLAHYLHYKLGLKKIREAQGSLHLPSYLERCNNFDSNSKKVQLDNFKIEDKSDLNTFALDVNNFRDLEEEVRNELDKPDEFGAKEMNYDSLLVKASLNLERKTSNPFSKNVDSNLLKQNSLNIFDDLSKTHSAGLLTQGNNTNNNKGELSFKDVKNKIGFKRQSNEVTQSKIKGDAGLLTQVNGKKVKKS